MDLSTVLRDTGSGTEIAIMVSPNAKASAIGEVDQWRKRLVVKVRAVPSEGRANRAVCELLEEVLGARVEIVHGAVDRHKTVLVPLPPAEVLRRLEAHAGR